MWDQFQQQTLNLARTQNIEDGDIQEVLSRITYLRETTTGLAQTQLVGNNETREEWKRQLNETRAAAVHTEEYINGQEAKLRVEKEAEMGLAATVEQLRERVQKEEQ